MFERGGESYELGPVHSAASRARPSLSQLVMPERYHRMLDAFLQGRGGSQDSDSDSDSDRASFDGDAFDDKHAGRVRLSRRGSLESLIREKKAREGINDEDGLHRNRDDGDLEAQPAWMRSPYISENNVLRVCR